MHIAFLLAAAARTVLAKVAGGARASVLCKQDLRDKFYVVAAD
jgi:hypothetical protein